MSIATKRIYEPYDTTDGYRVLVDRLWPRGIKKENARIDLWLKDIAPSAALHKWFNHEPEKWRTFAKKYHAELKDSNAVLAEITAILRKHKKVTLLYSAKDELHNQAVALQQLLSTTKNAN